MPASDIVKNKIYPIVSSCEVDLNDIYDIRKETDEQIKQSYLSLRAQNLTKEKAEQLEDALSTKIYRSEELIREVKNGEPEEVVNEYYRRRTALKRIADGLAWIILNFNAEALSAFSIGHSPGFMAGKQGYQYERNVVKALYHLSNIRYAIQCDITNILRISDVIAIKTDGQIMPLEVKGTLSGRSQRQKKRVGDILKFLRTGVLENAMKGFAPLQAYTIPIMFEHYWNDLEELSRRALHNGIAWSVLDQSVIIQVIKTEDPIEQVKIDEMVKEVNWDDATRTISSLGRHLTKDLAIMPRARLPLTIFPLSPEIGLKFTLGKLDAVIVLNKSEIVHRIQDKGLECTLHEDGSALVKTGSGNEFQILDAWDKMLNEMVTATSFVDYVVASSEKVDSERYHKLGSNYD